MASNPFDALKFFSGQNLQLLQNYDYNCDDHISISSVFPQCKSTSFQDPLHRFKDELVLSNSVT